MYQLKAGSLISCGYLIRLGVKGGGSMDVRSSSIPWANCDNIISIGESVDSIRVLGCCRSERFDWSWFWSMRLCRWNAINSLHVHTLQFLLIDLTGEGLLFRGWLQMKVDSTGQNLYHVFLYQTRSQVVLGVHRLEVAYGFRELEISLEH